MRHGASLVWLAPWPRAEGETKIIACGSGSTDAAWTAGFAALGAAVPVVPAPEAVISGRTWYTAMASVPPLCGRRLVLGVLWTLAPAAPRPVDRACARGPPGRGWSAGNRPVLSTRLMGIRRLAPALRGQAARSRTPRYRFRESSPQMLRGTLPEYPPEERSEAGPELSGAQCQGRARGGTRAGRAPPRITVSGVSPHRNWARRPAPTLIPGRHRPGPAAQAGRGGPGVARWSHRASEGDAGLAGQPQLRRTTSPVGRMSARGATSLPSIR